MGKRGPKPKDRCAHDHDLTAQGAVRVTKRKRTLADGTVTVYDERQCSVCRRKHAQAHHKRRQLASSETRESRAREKVAEELVMKFFDGNWQRASRWFASQE